jgi:hypothetical protein
MLTQQEAENLSERLQKLSCTNPEAGAGLFTFVLGGEQGGQKGAYESHVSECQYCQIALQVYRYKRDAAKLYNRWATGKEIVAQATDDSSILRRDLGNGTTAYFKPNQGQTNGTTVVVARSGEFLSVEENQSVDSFQQLTSVP